MVASANSWVKFFQAAGVPANAAATYAHIFYENRMDLDMLTDLNKEYLREMGITPMGDIISILRHSKKVYEQNTRDKILSEEKQSVTTVTVNPRVATIAATAPKKVISLKNHSNNTEDKPKIRRVLPEHEGRYKITLPSGSTERSKEILAKRQMLYSDKEEPKKGIFDRLEQTKSRTHAQIDKTSSIFARLGGKHDDEEMEVCDQVAVRYAAAMKNPPKQIESTRKTVKVQPKIVVKRVPAKAATMVADEYECDRMETGEKSVKFSSTDEILEIESRQAIARPTIRARLNKAFNVRARLGANKVSDSDTAINAALHRTKKVVKLKQPIKRANGQTLKVAPLKSDETSASVKSRLSMKKVLSTSDVNKVVNRIGRVSISSRLGATQAAANGNRKLPKKISVQSSVFDRLGFNKK